MIIKSHITRSLFLLLYLFSKIFLVLIIKSHITRSLFLLLYLFSKIFLVPRKRLRNQAGGQVCQRAKSFILIWGKPSILALFSLFTIFSYICVRSSLKIFSQISIYFLLFLRTKCCQERDLGLIIRPVLSWFWL